MYIPTQPSYILYADDDLDDRYLMQESFSKLNWSEHLKMFDSGKHLLNYLEALSNPLTYPTLIVLDYEMPLLNGAETLHYLKQNTRFRNIPVVIYSTSINPLLKEKLLLMGAKYCYQKVNNCAAAYQFAKALKMHAEHALTS